MVSCSVHYTTGHRSASVSESMDIISTCCFPLPQIHHLKEDKRAAAQSSGAHTVFYDTQVVIRHHGVNHVPAQVSLTPFPVVPTGPEGRSEVSWCPIVFATSYGIVFRKGMAFICWMKMRQCSNQQVICLQFCIWTVYVHLLVHSTIRSIFKQML